MVMERPPTPMYACAVVEVETGKFKVITPRLGISGVSGLGAYSNYNQLFVRGGDGFSSANDFEKSIEEIVNGLIDLNHNNSITLDDVQNAFPYPQYITDKVMTKYEQI